MLAAALAGAFCGFGEETVALALQGFYGADGHQDRTKCVCQFVDERFNFRFDVQDATPCAPANAQTPERGLEDFDRVELFFSPTADMSRPYVCAEIGANGAVLDYHATYYRQMNYWWGFETLSTGAFPIDGGYAVTGSVAVAELASVGIDPKRFWLGAFRADYAPGCRLVDWYAAVPQGPGDPDFHRPQLLMKVEQKGAKCETVADTPHTVLDLPPGTGNSRNSEGSLVELKDGRILFAYSKFIGGTGMDGDQCVIAARTSLDRLGDKWGPDRVVATNEFVAGGNVMSVSLLRLKDGRLALFYGCKLKTPEGLHYSIELMRTSTDEGKTWSRAKDISAGFPRTYCVLNNARIQRLKSGRILVPLADHGTYGTPDRPFKHHARIVCLYSDDDGETWKQSSFVDCNEADRKRNITFQEPGVIELKDGRTLLYFRTNVGRQYYAYSSDGGATWGAAEPSPLYSPLSPATIHRLKTGELICFWNDHENRPDLANGGPGWASGVRTPLTVGVSTDEGKTWPRRKQLEDKYDPKDWQRYWYCYTAVLELKDRLLVAYCAERNLKHLRITSVPLAWLP